MQTTQTSTFRQVLTFPTRSLRRLYDWTIRWGDSRYAQGALFTLAFAESSFFPIPPDVLLVAMTVANRFKWWFFAALTTVGSVLGAVLGYYIGLALYETVALPIVQFYHLDRHFEALEAAYNQNAILAVFTAAFTPIPFKAFTIAGGLFHIALTDLLIGSILGRAGRFFLVAGLLRLFGHRIALLIEKYFDILSLLFVVLLVGGFVFITQFR